MIGLLGRMGLAPLVGGLVVLVVLVAVIGWLRVAPAPAQQDWQIEDLVARLQRDGLKIRAVPNAETGPLNQGAYLTTTDKTWSQLNLLKAFTERINEWQGTVVCLRVKKGPLGEPLVQAWGEGWERVGPFAIFGDAELRSRIRQALKEVELSPS